MWILPNLSCLYNHNYTLLPFKFWGFWYSTYNTSVQSELEDKYNWLLKFNLLCFIKVNVPFLNQMTPIEVATERRHMDIVDYLRGCGMSDVSIDSGSKLILISVWAGLFPGHLTGAVMALYNYNNNLYCIFQKWVSCLIICYQWIEVVCSVPLYKAPELQVEINHSDWSVDTFVHNCLFNKILCYYRSYSLVANYWPCTLAMI